MIPSRRKGSGGQSSLYRHRRQSRVRPFRSHPDQFGEPRAGIASRLRFPARAFTNPGEAERAPTGFSGAAKRRPQGPHTCGFRPSRSDRGWNIVKKVTRFERVMMLLPKLTPDERAMVREAIDTTASARQRGHRWVIERQARGQRPDERPGDRHAIAKIWQVSARPARGGCVDVIINMGWGAPP